MKSSEQILKVDGGGRVWTPRELREGVLDEFERSGMPATKFARQVGVKYQTFASWVQKRRKERSGTKALRWVEAVPTATTGSARTLRVELPGGARMEIADRSQAELAAHLLRALATGGGPC
jgi:hypothetical protein